jgi:hypothetical protein
MTALLRVETVFVTVFGYPMSYLELAGTVFNLWSVWLVARKSILTWPVGIAGVILFAILFYQIQLYADLPAPRRQPPGPTGDGDRRLRPDPGAGGRSRRRGLTPPFPARHARATMQPSRWTSSSAIASS